MLKKRIKKEKMLPVSMFLVLLTLFMPTILKATTNEVNLIKKNSGVIEPFKLSEKNIIRVAASKEGQVNPNNPKVFIYHSHTTESYKPGPQDNLDPSKSVVAVGDIIAEELEKDYGIATIHDKTVHNNVYDQAYERSGETMDKYLSKYKDFKLIIDLHRDASTKGNKRAVSVIMNGKSLARAEFVIGTANKNHEQNLAVTRKLINISQALYPGLIRMEAPNDNGVFYWHSYFNQDKSSNAVLLEIGNEINTLDEAKNTALCVSKIIAQYINEKQ